MNNIDFNKEILRSRKIGYTRKLKNPMSITDLSISLLIFAVSMAVYGVFSMLRDL